MASNVQNKRLKMDVDYMSVVHDIQGNDDSDSSHAMEAQGSSGDSPENLDDYVFVDFTDDGRINCHNVVINGLDAGAARSPQRPCISPTVIDLTKEDSQPGFNFDQPSTSRASAAFNFHRPSTSTNGLGFGFDQPSTSAAGARFNFDRPSTSTADTSGASGSNSAENTDNTTQLLEDVQWVCAEARKTSPELEIDPNVVFVMLETCANKNQRRNLILRELTNKTTESDGEPDAGDLFEDVNKVIKAFPMADANIVYGLLESEGHQKTRVERVMDIMAAKFGRGSSPPRGMAFNELTSWPSAEQIPSTSEISEDDPLYDDVQSLAMLFPEKEESVLYKQLQIHRRKPNRIQIVSREMMTGKMKSGEDENDTEEPIECDMDSGEESDNAQPSTSAANKSDSGDDVRSLREDMELLSGFYPDCDPNHIFSRLDAHEYRENRVQIVFKELENGSYPSRKDVEGKQKRKKQIAQWLDVNNRLDELVETYDDISEQFYNFKTKVSSNYKKHLTALVEYDFPWLTPDFLKSVCESYDFHLLPSYRYLTGLRKSDVVKKNRRKPQQGRKKEDMPNYPQNLDEGFFRELQYVFHEGTLEKKSRKYKEERDFKFQEAKANGLLQECSCCYDDEVLMEDLLSCPEDHLFCKSCVRRSTEVVVGEAKGKFPCLSGDCETTFTLPVIQKAVSAKTYTLVLRRIQEEELREAGIENLVTCPFCSYATIMENPDDKVFKCLNPECMKESCRLCQEENHVPLRCDAVEKKASVDMRTFIEQRMTEAMLRTCHNCKKRFFKVEGCNKMTCVCGASMCYVCRAPIKDYQHFNNGKCNDQNANALHKKEVEEAFKNAQKEYLEEHPEARDVEMKHDPREHLNSMQAEPAHVHGHGWNFNNFVFAGMPQPFAMGRHIPPFAQGLARMFMGYQPEEEEEDEDEDVDVEDSDDDY